MVYVGAIFRRFFVFNEEGWENNNNITADEMEDATKLTGGGG